MAETPLRVLIVDDEAPARRRLRDLLDDCAAALPLDVVGEARTAARRSTCCKSRRPISCCPTSACRTWTASSSRGTC